MVESEAWGKLIQEKNQKQKISLHCPFKINLLEMEFRRAYKCEKSFKLSVLVNVSFLQPKQVFPSISCCFLSMKCFIFIITSEKIMPKNIVFHDFYQWPISKIF